MADPHSPDGPNGIYVLPPADISQVANARLDLPYAAGSAFQKLDLYLPNGAAPAAGWPLVIFIHGGAWMQCDKRDVQLEPALRLLKHGFALASINYRLSSEALFPAQIYDVKAAIRYLRATAPENAIDPARFGIWGLSAGGHLAALAATTNDLVLFEDLHMGHPETSSTVQAAVIYFGPTRLDEMDCYMAQTGAGDMDHLDPRSPESRLLGGVPSTKPALVTAANPETWVTPACPPFFIAHAPMDELVPVQHGIHLSQRITAVCGNGHARLRLIEGGGHATPHFATAALTDEVAGFFERHL